MKKIIVSESKKRNYVSSNGNRYRTKMVTILTHYGKKVNGKPAYYSRTQYEPIFE